jgi:hypothetical protein
MPGYVGGKLKADASTREIPNDAEPARHGRRHRLPGTSLPEVSRRAQAHHRQRRVVVDQRLIDDTATTPWEPYPCMDADGNVIDEPAIHRISYTVNPDGDDTDWSSISSTLQRTINDCWNKLLEWKNRCLMPQMIGAGRVDDRPSDDVPGAINYYRPTGGNKPEWERPPAVPRELFDMLELAITHMRAIAADIDVQPDPNLAAKTANAAIEQSQARWQSFLGDLAEFHSRLMRHCLMLVARNYDEQRQIEIRGQYGWQPMKAFAGQDSAPR